MNRGFRQVLLEEVMHARLDLVREICEDLRSGLSPYPRLHRAHLAFSKGKGLGVCAEELAFVGKLFGVLMGVTHLEALDRLELLLDHTPKPEHLEQVLVLADHESGLSRW